MRWVKHLSASHSDDKLAQILEEFGAEGFGVYWLLVEHIAQPMESGKMTPSLTRSDVKWAAMCGCSVRVYRSITKKMSDLGLIDTETIDNRMKITIPNILKYKDEYAKKSGHAQDKLPTRADTDTDREQIQKEKEEQSSSSSSPPKTQARAKTDDETLPLKTKNGKSKNGNLHLPSEPPPDREFIKEQIQGLTNGIPDFPLDEELVESLTKLTAAAPRQIVTRTFLEAWHNAARPVDFPRDFKRLFLKFYPSARSLN